MQLYPAMKAGMGDWEYYIVRMTMREIAREVQLASELWHDRTLGDAIQRILDESRVKQQIVNYLARRDDRFFSSLVVAAIGGNPSWTPVDSRFGETFGELAFQIDPRYFALDGQHRLKAIKELMADPAGAPPGFAEEQVSVLVVVREHQNVDDGLWLQRYRRLFSSLNRYAKPTDTDTNIIMDEDDVFAILTRRLITDHEFFRAPSDDGASVRVLTKGKNLRTGAPQYTSLQTLYAMNKTLLLTPERRRIWGRTGDLKVILQSRPDEDDIDRYYEALANQWDALLRAIPVLREEPERMRSHDVVDVADHQVDAYRDHLLFWPIGQELLAEIVRSLLDRAGLGDEAPITRMEAELRPLDLVPWNLHEAPWRHLLLIPGNPPKHTVWRIRSEERKAALQVGAGLLRWMVGLDPLNEEEVCALRDEWWGLLYGVSDSESGPDATWREVIDGRERIVNREQ